MSCLLWLLGSVRRGSNLGLCTRALPLLAPSHTALPSCYPPRPNMTALLIRQTAGLPASLPAAGRGMRSWLALTIWSTPPGSCTCLSNLNLISRTHLEEGPSCWIWQRRQLVALPPCLHRQVAR